MIDSPESTTDHPPAPDAAVTNEIAKLSPLIKRAAAALAKATTAAEVLDAKREATVAYDAAKLAARLAKFKDAHDTIIAACHKTQADALVIEAQAQCRLADEYDAAQERGEVKSAGQPRKSNIPNENNTSTVTDIGLTSKQIHEARTVRDAEKAKPGVVRETVEAKLEAKKEPTRADVKRAVKTPTPQTEPAEVSAKRRKAEYANLTGPEPMIDPATLSMTAQQKLDAAKRQQERTLGLRYRHDVQEAAREAIDEMILPHWKQQIEQAKKLSDARTALMDKGTFNKIRRALHPDSRHAASDKVLADAFDAFMALEKYLLEEKDSPTTWPELPKTIAEWEKTRKPKRGALLRDEKDSAKAALSEFDGCVLRLLQMAGNAKPGQFAKTGVNADRLMLLGVFLTQLAEACDESDRRRQ